MSPSDVPANAALLHGGLSTGLHVGGNSGPLNALLWAKSQHLPLEITRQLQGIYGDHFPVEARHALAGWIETTAFNEELDTSNPQYEEHARIMVQTMVQQLQIKAAECLDYHHKQKLEHIVEHFKVNRATQVFVLEMLLRFLKSTAFLDQMKSKNHEVFPTLISLLTLARFSLGV